MLTQAVTGRGLAQAVRAAFCARDDVPEAGHGYCSYVCDVTLCSFAPVRRYAHETFWRLRAMDSRYQEVSILS